MHAEGTVWRRNTGIASAVGLMMVLGCSSGADDSPVVIPDSGAIEDVAARIDSKAPEQDMGAIPVPDTGEDLAVDTTGDGRDAPVVEDSAVDVSVGVDARDASVASSEVAWDDVDGGTDDAGDSLAGVFESLGNIARPGRYFQTATLLKDGTVLLAGGSDWPGGGLVQAEIYDPATRSFKLTGSLKYARQAHTATLLPNGKVLIAGGYGGEMPVSAELYDPATGTFETTGVMTPRRSATATLLPNGKVLVAGGSATDRLASAELYDPSTGTFTATGSMSTPRGGHTATLLADGRVLIAGGICVKDESGVAEIYDSVTGVFTMTGAMTTPRCKLTATLLPNGKVLLMSSKNSSDTRQVFNEVDLYDPLTGLFTAAAPLPPRTDYTATLLPSGEILVAGGMDLLGGNGLYSMWSLKTAFLYDPSTGLSRPTGSLNTGREHQTATLLPKGEVLIVGFGTAELYRETRSE